MFDSSAVMLNPDEQDCEEFLAILIRGNLPFKISNVHDLKFNGSFNTAVNILRRNESRFSKDKIFQKAYIDFMRNYEDTGHMMVSKFSDLIKCFFLPHHGFVKKHGINPKFRSFFNGFAEDYNKLSINSILHTGTNLLPDLAELLTGWRKYRFVFVSDIEQMFRQIRVHPDDQKFQQIVWRYNLNDEIKTYSLQTVTYGMVSNPFLAIRVLRQLAIDEGHKFPLDVQVLNEETYMDDTLSGGHTLSEATKKQKELIGICKMGGMNLHKWVANDINLLDFPRSIVAESLDSCFGLLGLNWYPDYIYYYTH